MFELSNIRLQQLAVHRTGNKYRAERNFQAQALTPLNEELTALLLKYFLKSFRPANPVYHFQHSSDLNLNEVYSYATTIFEDPERLLEQSLHILQHLYNQSNHPNIKSGELYVAYFEDILVEDELVSALGIFKSERKNSFLRVKEGSATLNLQPLEGISIDRLDKGCLILNTAADDGYRVWTVDNNHYDAQYWPRDFLGIQPIEDHHHHTRQFLELCEAYSNNLQESESDRTEQVRFMAASADYFQNHEVFDFEDFSRQALPEEKSTDLFRHFQEELGVEAPQDFPISPEVVRQNRRKFKSQINLDTGIRIHLDLKDPGRAENYLERHFDEDKGMYYYKIYFNEEL
jgi:hypothetical protein